MEYDSLRLEIIFGPMMGGKSTELARRVRVKSVYKKVLAVNSKKDIRYGNDGIITHSGQKIEAVRIDELKELLELDEYKNSSVISIDEAQFYKGLYEFITEQLETTNKTFILAGLIGDKNKNLFGDLYKLIPHAESVHFLKAICKRCGDGTPASFTASLTYFSGQEKIGGSESYEAVCRKHFNEIKQENIRNSK